jgi:hypothetical protein
MSVNLKNRAVTAAGFSSSRFSVGAKLFSNIFEAMEDSKNKIFLTASSTRPRQGAWGPLPGLKNGGEWGSGLGVIFGGCRASGDVKCFNATYSIA